jgi:hypothetical protein
VDLYIDGAHQQPSSYTVVLDQLTLLEVPHIGALITVKIGKPIGVGTTDALLVEYNPAGTGAVPTTVQAKLRESVSVLDFGFKSSNTGAANGTIVPTLIAEAQSGTVLHIPNGTYLTDTPLNFTGPINITADLGARIKLTAAASYVMQLDFTNSGSFFDYGASLKNLILDGAGFCADALLLKGVISSNFENIRATNVTGAGLHLAWAQLCNFTNYICSDNVETYTTTPVNGVLIDGATSSANTFTNPIIEAVSGSGIKGLSSINTVFINGTSEGNDIGIEFGTTVSVGQVSSGNTVIGMDLEVNTTADIVLRETSGSNTFLGLSAGFSSPAIQVIGSVNNCFYGGVTSGFDFSIDSRDNTVDSVKLLGTGATITNSGTRNVWKNVYNVTDTTVIADSVARTTLVTNVANGATLAINAATTRAVVGVATGPTYTAGNPTNPVDGMYLDVTVRNESLGATAITWSSAFKIAGWVDPANAFSRTVQFRYDSTYAKWYALAISGADIPN